MDRARDVFVIYSLEQCSYRYNFSQENEEKHAVWAVT